MTLLPEAACCARCSRASSGCSRDAWHASKRRRARWPDAGFQTSPRCPYLALATATPSAKASPRTIRGRGNWPRSCATDGIALADPQRHRHHRLEQRELAARSTRRAAATRLRQPADRRQRPVPRAGAGSYRERVRTAAGARDRTRARPHRPGAGAVDSRLGRDAVRPGSGRAPRRSRAELDASTPRRAPSARRARRLRRHHARSRANAAPSRRCWPTTACIRPRRCMRCGRNWRCRSRDGCCRSERRRGVRPRHRRRIAARSCRRAGTAIAGTTTTAASSCAATRCIRAWPRRCAAARAAARPGLRHRPARACAARRRRRSCLSRRRQRCGQDRAGASRGDHGGAARPRFEMVDLAHAFRRTRQRRHPRRAAVLDDAAQHACSPRRSRCWRRGPPGDPHRHRGRQPAHARDQGLRSRRQRCWAG